jgi:hypothetical protein
MPIDQRKSRRHFVANGARFCDLAIRKRSGYRIQFTIPIKAKAPLTSEFGGV